MIGLVYMNNYSKHWICSKDYMSTNDLVNCYNYTRYLVYTNN